MDGPRAIDDAWPAGAGGGVRISVLGPVRLEIDDVERSLTAPRQRAVLACLVLHAGEAVSADRLLHDVWGDELPRSGAKAVAYQIFKLRGLLGPAGASVIATSTAGYCLELPPDRIDVHVADELIDRARDALPADPRASEALIERALRLHRGRPFADLDDVFLDDEVRRIEGRHLLARRTLAEARLAQGRSPEVIDDLGVLLAEQPLEEAVAGVLMTALERSGRTADALRVFGDLRRRLASELGIEPSAQLRRLEQQLLSGEDTGEQAPIPAGNLPTPLSSFVGRQPEIDEIVTLLARARLVTLLSFGGVGKTRLAIEVAAHLRDRFADGVWFVDLLRINDPVLLPETFIAGVGVPATAARDRESYLHAALAAHRALVVVDNCEHLGADVGQLVDRLLRHARGVRVLATSRVSLGVRDEVVWQVPPLPTDTAAVELFVERALLVRPGSVGEADRAVLAQIGERLDGIPLAIELASARLRTMSLEQLAEHLEDRFRLLTTMDRRADDRHRSLLATMTWSYELLDGPDRELLGWMSVCTDGFPLDAAVASCGGDPLDVVDRLARLVDTGLLTFADRDGVGRYRMLETVRDFAAAQLAPGERMAAEQVHVTYFAGVAAQVAARKASGDDDWIHLGDREIGNLRAAMAWAFANGRPRVGMAMANDLWGYFWQQTSGSNENVRWGRLALDLIDEDDDDVMLVAAGTVIEAYNLGDVEVLRSAAERVRRGLDAARDPVVRSRLLAALGTSVMDTDPRAAETYLDEAWATAPLRPASISILNNHIELSWLAGVLSDGDSVVARLHDVLAVTPDRPPTAVKIEAGVAACAGRFDDVLRLTQALTGTDKMLNDAHILRSEALGALGRFDEAVALVGEPQVNDYWADVQRVHLVGAAIDLARGDPAAALDRLRLVLAMTAADPRPLALDMHVAALLAVTVQRLGHDDVAASLFGFAAAERRRLGISLRPSHRPLVDTGAASCRTALGGACFDELAAAGASATFRTLVAGLEAETLVPRP